MSKRPSLPPLPSEFDLLKKEDNLSVLCKRFSLISKSFNKFQQIDLNDFDFSKKSNKNSLLSACELLKIIDERKLMKCR